MLDKKCSKTQQKIIPINYITANNRKPQDSIEIIVSLFTDCNLRCQFCGDRYRQLEKFSYNGLQRRLENIISVLDHVCPKCVYFKIFGGELFQDKFGDDVFEQYDNFFHQISNQCIKRNIQYYIDISTNAVYYNVHRVVSLAKKWNLKFRCSYDFYGRFTKQRQKDIFKQNVDELQNNNIPVSIATILTTQLIDIVTSETNDLHEEWDSLYNSYNISIDYYDPETLLPEEGIVKRSSTITDAFLPNDQQIINFFKYCIKKYPNLSIIESLIQSYNTHNATPHCMHGVAISSQIYWECCDMEKVRQSFISNKQCPTCRHMSYCNGTCNRLFYNSKTCYLHEVYNFLENENSKN